MQPNLHGSSEGGRVRKEREGERGRGVKGVGGERGGLLRGMGRRGENYKRKEAEALR